VPASPTHPRQCQSPARLVRHHQCQDGTARRPGRIASSSVGGSCPQHTEQRAEKTTSGTSATSRNSTARGQFSPPGLTSNSFDSQFVSFSQGTGPSSCPVALAMLRPRLASQNRSIRPSCLIWPQMFMNDPHAARSRPDSSSAGFQVLIPALWNELAVCRRPGTTNAPVLADTASNRPANFGAMRQVSSALQLQLFTSVDRGRST
jgi:hypothetical protein